MYMLDYEESSLYRSCLVHSLIHSLTHALTQRTQQQQPQQQPHINNTGLDSFAAFEEVLHLAKRFQCDMVLIAGDLFHDNRPSRTTMHKTMEILRNYCLGPGAVKIQILSDPATTLSTSQRNVNYLSEYHSVDLPVFSIHGNHDDPTRDTGGQLLAALDLLSVSSLINYFGRQDQVDQVQVRPILIQKGTTRVALYGMGSMRDERLNRMWQTQKVRFLRPEEDNDNDNDDEDNEDEDNDSDGFFNLFALHQNRDLGRGPKNCVQESMIPEWMDLVVWGHEHECLIEFFESVVGTFRITQPGSSVATSLVAGEAVRKKVGILDIQGKNFRLHPVPLTQVRSFVTTEVSLKEHRDELDADDPKIDEKVTQILEEEVRLMVMQGRDKMQQVREEAKAAGSNAGEEDCPLKYKLAKPDEVLVRVRVEHSGFTSLNNQRFGARFVGQVANPDDVLLFHRKKEFNAHAKATKKRSGLNKPIPPEELERTNMEDLVKELLGAPEQKLRLLNEPVLSVAMEEFVDKSLAQSIPDAAKEMLDSKQKKLIDRGGKDDNGDFVGKPAQVREEFDQDEDEDAMDDEQESQKATKPSTTKRKKATYSELEEEEDVTGKENQLEEEAPAARSTSRARPSAKSARAAPKTSQRATARRRKIVGLEDDDDGFDNDDDDDDDMEVEEAPKSRSSARPKRAAPKKSVNYSLDDDDSDAPIELDDDDDDDDEILVVEKPKKRAPAKKAASRTTASTRKTTTSGSSRKTKTTAKPSRRQLDDSEDDEFDYRAPPGTADIDDDWGTAPTRSEI
jgi:double-strand break repair protein MRE11